MANYTHLTVLLCPAFARPVHVSLLLLLLLLLFAAAAAACAPGLCGGGGGAAAFAPKMDMEATADQMVTLLSVNPQRV